MTQLRETSSVALQWAALREHIARQTTSNVGRERVLALEPSIDLDLITLQQERIGQLRSVLAAGISFGFGGLFDPTDQLDHARIAGAALEATDIRSILNLAELIEAWRNLAANPPDAVRSRWGAISDLSQPIVDAQLGGLLHALRGKIEPDGSLSDDASPELASIRRGIARQHRLIEESLRRSLRSLSESGIAQDELITLRGDRFVIPVKTELRRRVPGVIHGSSGSGQTVFVEPMETVESNNELLRLMDEELAEIHRILVAMTRSIGEHAAALGAGAEVLTELDKLFACAKLAQRLDCVRPMLTPGGNVITVRTARHPLLDLRLREEGAAIIPLSLILEEGSRQLIISGPNTGGKTVALKTLGLLALMAQAGLPVPAEEASLPIFTAIYADIGDAQSIERNLSTFSAHITNVDHITRSADDRSLVLLDELGSATDPEEGAALAVAIAEHFLNHRVWTFISTHLNSLKIYAATHEGVVNAAVGFNEVTLAPTYELRLGVPGASAGINIAQRIGLSAEIVAVARGNLDHQTADIGRFLDELHAQLDAAKIERHDLHQREAELKREIARLELEGRQEQRAKARELEQKLNELLKEFEYQMRETANAITDKAAAKKVALETERRLARLRREFSEQFNSTVVAHISGADKKDPNAQPHIVREISPGDVVKLKSLGREARVDRQIDANTFEVSMGRMKMRVARSDIATLTVTAPPVSPLVALKGRRNITVSMTSDADNTPREINVIGRTADEARDEVERFLNQAFLAGYEEVRIVHGTGMGVLRRTLREYLRKQPNVATITEPPYNEGGQGATLVGLKQ